MKQITPIIKRTRVSTTRYEVCPHCQQEILEKSHYVDPENYVYHRPCIDKGPIDQIKPMSPDEFDRRMKGTAYLQHAASIEDNDHRSGTLHKNFANVDYAVQWTAEIAGQKVFADVSQPENMPDYLWFQIKGAMKSEAETEARKMMAQKEMSQSAFSDEDGDGNWLERAAAANGKGKTIPLKPASQPIDEGLLADGLGAFLDVFINYHSGSEGDKLSKWIIALCRDPQYASVAKKLEQFHVLMKSIYQDVVEIAKGNAKVAAVADRGTKTAMHPNPWNTAKPSRQWHDFDFDGFSLSWKDENGNDRDTSLDDLVAWLKENRIRGESAKLPTGETLTKFVDATGIPDEPIESLIYMNYDYLGIIFDFHTAKRSHRIRFFHNGQGRVEF